MPNNKESIVSVSVEFEALEDDRETINQTLANTDLEFKIYPQISTRKGGSNICACTIPLPIISLLTIICNRENISEIIDILNLILKNAKLSRIKNKSRLRIRIGDSEFVIENVSEKLVPELMKEIQKINSRERRQKNGVLARKYKRLYELEFELRELAGQVDGVQTRMKELNGLMKSYHDKPPVENFDKARFKGFKKDISRYKQELNRITTKEKRLGDERNRILAALKS